MTRKTLLTIAGALLLALAALWAGYLMGGGAPEQAAPTPAAEAEVWTCSMHPQIRQPGPGQCPLCGMDLIPVKSESGGGSSGTLALSPHARKLAEVQTTRVERKAVTAEIRMVGKVDYDETRLGAITAWVPGRIDRMFVNFTGVGVTEGEHMVYLYSPDLLAAQEELLQTIKADRQLGRSDVESVRTTTRETVEASREKLRLLGLTPTQIAETEKRGTASDHMVIYAPMTGIVIGKNALEGQYVQTGTRLYSIADLTHVWVVLEAYESDLPWIRYGQEVEFTSEAYPGETFPGRISFIDPVLTDKTRTIKVRVSVENPEGKLKPGMFVHGLVRAPMGSGGRVLRPDLKGKWICSMHPEIVKNGPEACDICGMDLVPAERLGLGAEEPVELPLAVPASAPLLTGRRAVVYVERKDGDGRFLYEGREVTLGPRAGDEYIVLSGLEEGDVVVTRGNFKIDSALQIMAKPSMMSPPAPEPERGHAESPTAMVKDPGAVYRTYLEVHRALAHDSLEDARKAASALAKLMPGDAESIRDATDISTARGAFARVSEVLAAALRGSEGIPPAFLFHCPMAFGGRGAVWIQSTTGTENPYFGAAMLKCGAVQETLRPEVKHE